MTANSSTIASSRAQAPDLDWSQVTETVRMLNLAVAQISLAMHEGDDSVGALSNSFFNMASSIDQIGELAASTGEANGLPAVRGEILKRCAGVKSSIQQSIVAFQFYDRLSQRLDHVRDSLEQLSELVADRARLFNPMEWEGLQAAIRSRYTMVEEQEMFDCLLRGEGVDQALEKVRGKLNDGEIDDIELF